MAHAEGPSDLVVSVAFSPREGEVVEVKVRLVAGATLADALRASGLLERYPEIDPAVRRVGVWGKVCRIDTPLHPRDRVEVYRALTIDPMQARRERQRRQRPKPTRAT